MVLCPSSILLDLDFTTAGSSVQHWLTRDHIVINAQASCSMVCWGNSPRQHDKLHNSSPGALAHTGLLMSTLGYREPRQALEDRSCRALSPICLSEDGTSDCHLTGHSDVPRRPEELAQRDASGSDGGCTLGSPGRPQSLTLRHLQ